MRRWVYAKVVVLFGADLRSLAALRVVLAVLVLADLASRAADLSAHYTDRGILPRSVLMEEEVLNGWSFSLNLINGKPLFQALIFGVAALAALGLLVGYRTRLMTVAVWVLLISIQWRNPMVLSAGDILLGLLLFWGMFLPLGACWSIDRALEPERPRLSMRFLSFATVGLFLQIAFVYWFTVVHKSGPEWRVDGTAIYYALSIDQLTTPIGAYLLNFPTLLTVLTFATIGLEALGPLLLFFPFVTGPVRTGTVAAFVSFHFGIWLTMYIGIFPWISALCMVCFLPGWFWDRAAPKLGAALPKRLDDSTRTLLPAARGLMRTYRLPLRERLSVTADAGQPAMGGRATYDEPGRRHAGHASASSSTTSATRTEQQGETRPATKAGYGPPRNGTPGRETITLRSSLAANLLALFFLLYVFCWNLTTVSEFAMPERLVALGRVLSLGQSWAMFAPYPSKNEGWHVIPGTLGGGQRVDLMATTRDDFGLHEEASEEKPRHVTDQYKNERWRKYLARIQETEYVDQHLHFGRYICREWNARHADAEQLVNFQIVFMKEQTLPDYQFSAPEKALLWEHRC